MKHFILGFVSALILLLAYWAWPFFALHALAADVQARDAVALSKLVDIARLRQSLGDQIAAAYLRDKERAGRPGVGSEPAESLAGGAIADPLVAQIINPENLIALLDGETIATEFGTVSVDLGELPTTSLDAALRAWLGSDYWVDRFSTALPVTAEPRQQFRLRMQLLQWQWRLTGIDLPEEMRVQMARQLTNPLP
jgi:hypothetical protein